MKKSSGMFLKFPKENKPLKYQVTHITVSLVCFELFESSKISFIQKYLIKTNISRFFTCYGMLFSVLSVEITESNTR